MFDFDFSAKRILIIDDSRHFLALMSSILHGFGCRGIYRCTSAGQAFEVLDREVIDMALVDSHMPMIDGFEFATLVRGARETSRCLMPMIMVTGHGSREAVMKGIECGYDDFVVKPLRPVVLYQKMVRHFEKPQDFVMTPDGYFGPERRRKTDPPNGVSERRVRDFAVKVPRTGTAEIQYLDDREIVPLEPLALSSAQTPHIRSRPAPGSASGMRASRGRA